jgi:hypothetical protein
MLQIQCTQRLQKYIGITPQPLPTIPNTTPLGVWYANLIYYEGADFLLFANHPSLYSVLVYISESNQDFDIFQLFMEMLVRNLILDGVDELTIRRIVSGYEPAILTKTANRSMLGSMNDLKHIMLANMDRQLERFNQIELSEVEYYLNRIPQRKLDWGFAVEVMREISGSL